MRLKRLGLSKTFRRLVVTLTRPVTYRCVVIPGSAA
ncbi:DUF5983 family protein [Escherichia coli]